MRPQLIKSSCGCFRVLRHSHTKPWEMAKLQSDASKVSDPGLSRSLSLLHQNEELLKGNEEMLLLMRTLRDMNMSTATRGCKTTSILRCRKL